MKVLLLSPYPGRITQTFAREGDTVLACSDPIDRSFLAANMIDWVVSYGYRHILKADVVTACRNRIVNLHISLLPWNRGADPNFWSFIDATPKGVTIHRIDEGIDTGPILVQRAVRFTGGETLATSFARLCSETEALFDEMWPDIRNGRCTPRCHDGVGSYHRARDKDVYFESLPLGWETPVADVEALGRRARATRGELRDSDAGSVKTVASATRSRPPVIEAGLTLTNGWHRFTAAEVTLWAKGHLFRDEFARVARHLAATGAFEADAVEDLLQGLDGHWALVAVGSDRAFAAVDRVRSIPLTWARDGESILVDQDGGRVARRLNLTPEDVDRNAALSVALAGYTIGNDTLYSRVRQIGPGEYVLVEGPGEVRTGRYYQWTPWRPEAGSPADFVAPLSRLHERLIDKLVESARGRRILVPLSAGFDSRFIASGLREAGYRDVVCFAYGLPGNRDALISRLVAGRLGYSWRFVPYGNAAMRRVFASQDHARYKAGADSLTGVHFPQDYLALDALIADGVAGPEAIVVNGQSGDFITGNHVPAALAAARPDCSPAARQEAIVEALLAKHFKQWGFLRTPANMARLAVRLQREIAQIGMPANADGDHGVYEHCEFQDRQAKYVINGQRLYEHFGLNWRLPFWDRDCLDFWSHVPLAAKVGQALYRQTLVSRNWAGVWGDDVPVNPMRIRPGWLRPIRFALKALHAPLGRARWHAFERRYLDYWMTPLCTYAIRRWVEVASDGRGHTDPRAFHIESYLSEKGVRLEELVQGDAA